MRATRRLVMVAMTALVARAAAAQNMLSNPGFDTDVLGWQLGGTFDASRDGNGSSASGSLQLSPTIAGCAVSQQSCLPVEPGSKYLFGGQILFPRNEGANVGSGGAFLGVLFVDGPCGGSTKGFALTTSLPNGGTSETWATVSGSVVAPAGAMSAVFTLETCADTTDNVTANFDNVSLAPVTSIPTLGVGGEALLVVALVAGALAALRRRRPQPFRR